MCRYKCEVYDNRWNLSTSHSITRDANSINKEKSLVAIQYSNRTKCAVWHHRAAPFRCGFPIRKKFCEGPLNKHFFQVLVAIGPWFRTLKCEKSRRAQVIKILYTTFWVRWTVKMFYVDKKKKKKTLLCMKSFQNLEKNGPGMNLYIF